MFSTKTAKRRRLLFQAMKALRLEISARSEQPAERSVFVIEYDFLKGLTEKQAMHLLARMILQCEDLRSETLIFRLKLGKVYFIVDSVEYEFLTSQVAEVVDIARALLGTVEWASPNSGSIRLGKGRTARNLAVTVDLQDKWEIVVTIHPLLEATRWRAFRRPSVATSSGS